MEVFNWNEIKNKYPELFDLYCNDEGVTDKFVNLVNHRNLYDFFDKHWIYIEVRRYVLANDDGKQWFFQINSTKDFFDYCLYSDRKEAELKAFEKACEILNNKLK